MDQFYKDFRLVKIAKDVKHKRIDPFTGGDGGNYLTGSFSPQLAFEHMQFTCRGIFLTDKAGTGKNRYRSQPRPLPAIAWAMS